MPLRDAVHLAFTEHSPGEIQIYPGPIARDVVLRRQTTDVQCLEKVFIGSEYHSPFKLSPQVIVDAGANVGMATIVLLDSTPALTLLPLSRRPRFLRCWSETVAS